MPKIFPCPPRLSNSYIPQCCLADKSHSHTIHANTIFLCWRYTPSPMNIEVAQQSPQDSKPTMHYPSLCVLPYVSIQVSQISGMP